MKHTLFLDGYCYKLRPVNINDAAFILKIRLEDRERNKYIHEIPNDISLEEQWIKKYYEREGDYFFIIENKFTGLNEGIISIYDEKDGKAEWGRWVLQKGSMASVESVYLLYKIAFDYLKLEELYCRTVKNNESVISFHESTGLKTRSILKEFFVLNDFKYDAVEQYINRSTFNGGISEQLLDKSMLIFKRFLKNAAGKLEFHHMGIACRSIDYEISTFKMLGYRFEDKHFIDNNQGIMGKFGVAEGQPRVELLQNMENSNTLDVYLEKGIKIYHYAYIVNNIERATEYIRKCKGVLVSPLKLSSYFGKRICFFMMSNMLLIELIEE